MKKMTLRKLFGGLCCAAMVLFAASCAQGVDDESWSAGVTNTQLEPPTIEDSCFDVISTSEGEKVQFTWPVVFGANGYHVTVVEESNPDTPIVDEQVDGQTIAFAMIEDTNYNITVKSMGNDRYNNTESAAGEYVFSTYGTLQEIPNGSDIAEWITANYIAPEKEIFGLVYQLEAGGQYTLNNPIDFNLDKVMVRTADASNPAIITVSEGGCFQTQAGLKVLNIKFDCTAQTSEGLIAMSPTPDPSIENKVLGYTGGNSGNYLVLKPIIVENVWIKNLPKALLYDSKQKYAVKDFRILNCLIQCKNGTGTSFLDFDNGGIVLRDMTVENNTIWNVSTNKSGYVIRFSNGSNSQKAFGSNSSVQSNVNHVWNNNTFAKMMTGKDFANNMPTRANAYFTMTNNNFFDCYRLYQYLQNNATTHCKDNVIWYVETSPQSNDTGSRKPDTGDAFFAKLEEGTTPNANAADLPVIDLNAENGGVNFKASGALSSTVGDPRWL
ncbi:MAG: DUF4992 family lipoprotein [Rikenellaceae bacterium]|nr:DUF4992 family lipoprotein [Rikenellaceae bacterium]